MLTLLKRLLIALVVLALGLVAAGQLGALRGHRPPDLGVNAGRLKPPSATPNSVSSQAALYPDHPMRAYASVDPLPLHGAASASMQALRQLVEAQPGARVIEQREDYLYAEFTTPVLKFVDDVEFWADPVAQVIQVRSASRIGRGDMGVNRRRIEALRTQWAASAKP
jgi:uncharacterized protein (DUF1499 family)